MDRAGLERTLFYRHFENVGQLLLSSGRQAIDQLYAAQVALAATRADHGPEAVREALEVPVRIYRRHGPLLRAVSEAVAANQLDAVDQAAIRRRFDELVIEALRAGAAENGIELANVEETARALNLLNEGYLLDAFGREPRVSVEVATAHPGPDLVAADPARTSPPDGDRARQPPAHRARRRRRRARGRARS